MITKTRQATREQRRGRVRAKINGTASCPRLSVFRSLRGMYVQLIDDAAGKTLVSADPKKDYTPKSDAGKRTGKTAIAYVLGKALAEKAKAKGITSIVFDRGGYRYHGRVQAVAEGAREGGLQF